MRSPIIRFKTFVQHNLALTLLIFCTLGLMFPHFGDIPSWVIIASLAWGIFIACFGIQSKELRQIRISRISFFYISRFLIFPALLYYVFIGIAPKYALGLFLLAALPPGVSTPAMSRLFGGNVSLSFALTLLGNLLVPIVLPALLFIVAGQHTDLDIPHLFYTLLFSILVPIALFLILRKKQSVQSFIHREGGFLTPLCIGLNIAIAVAKRRAQILEDPASLIPIILFSSIAFAAFYAIGWFFNRKAPLSNKLAYSLGSGAINISLGVSIALLYFPADISLFLIVAEIPWILSLMPFKTLGLRHAKEETYARTS